MVGLYGTQILFDKHRAKLSFSKIIIYYFHKFLQMYGQTFEKIKSFC